MLQFERSTDQKQVCNEILYKSQDLWLYTNKAVNSIMNKFEFDLRFDKQYHWVQRALQFERRLVNYNQEFTNWSIFLDDTLSVIWMILRQIPINLLIARIVCLCHLTKFDVNFDFL